jgi:hypothetical protein
MRAALGEALFLSLAQGMPGYAYGMALTSVYNAELVYLRKLANAFDPAPLVGAQFLCVPFLESHMQSDLTIQTVRMLRAAVSDINGAHEKRNPDQKTIHNMLSNTVSSLSSVLLGYSESVQLYTPEQALKSNLIRTMRWLLYNSGAYHAEYKLFEFPMIGHTAEEAMVLHPIAELPAYIIRSIDCIMGT